MIYPALLHTHSGLRYLILALIIFTFLKSLFALLQKTDYRKIDDRLAFFTMIFIHIQFLIGLALYFISPKVAFTDMAITMKNSMLRYFTVEHIFLMLVVVVLVTIGRIVSKKKTKATQKHKVISIYFGLSLLLIILTVYVMIP